MDTAPLRDAYRALLDAAAVVAEQGGATAVPQDGEWDADRILAHIALVDAATLATAATIASGSAATYDNRHSHDTWTSRRVTALAGGNAGLRDRIRRQGEALCSLSAVLSDAELDVAVPTLLLSHDEVVLDQPSRYRSRPFLPAWRKTTSPSTQHNYLPCRTTEQGPQAPPETSPPCQVERSRLDPVSRPRAWRRRVAGVRQPSTRTLNRSPRFLDCVGLP